MDWEADNNGPQYRVAALPLAGCRGHEVESRHRGIRGPSGGVRGVGGIGVVGGLGG